MICKKRSSPWAGILVAVLEEGFVGEAFDRGEVSGGYRVGEHAFCDTARVPDELGEEK